MREADASRSVPSRPLFRAAPGGAGLAKEATQIGLVQKMAMPLQPPRVLDKQIATVAAGIAALLRRLAPHPSRDGLGDPALFGRICKVREEIAEAMAALDRFATLKGMHDALHIMQVFGTAWLDTIPAPASTVSAPLQSLIDGVKIVAARPSAALPPDYADCHTRYLQTVIDAERRIATGSPDGRDYAHATLAEHSLLSEGVPAEERQRLIDEIVEAGAVIPLGADRDASRNLLVFSSSNQAASGERDVAAAPPSLRPLDERRVIAAEFASPTPAVLQNDAEARRIVRIASMARQWRLTDPASQRGHLINDAATLAEAAL